MSVWTNVYKHYSIIDATTSILFETGCDFYEINIFEYAWYYT